MATESDDRTSLDRMLSNLLGFDDGVGSIVEHLLAIETRAELLDYLSEFLGSSSPAVRDFADQVARFKRNEPLVLEAPNKAPPPPSETSRTEPSSKESEFRTRMRSPPSGPSRESQGATRKTASIGNVSNKAPKAATKVKPKPPPASTSKSASVSLAPPDQTPTKSNAQQPPSAPTSIQKSRPRKGTNPVNCGCYGRIHPPLTNCLFCGRVTCEREGYNFCAYCGYMVEEVVAPAGADGPGGGGGGGGSGGTSSIDTAAIAAWRHKERLLRYDRDFAARTAVFDDQADYYSKDSAWLTAEEREHAEQQERERQEELLRKRMQLRLRIE